ncbi:hypothetical protein EDC04DRAFT_2610772 [Pisolithus marmoratus]|nr:hypothetical protein EDC04DRAFT_2613860 [Pisolithus marmoratus]KAI6009053.1 hypothetical protein EDC04DRAFT_2610772 [Pisolithus marmoratus]
MSITNQSGTMDSAYLRYFVAAKDGGNNTWNLADHKNEMAVDADRQYTRSQYKETQESRIVEHNEMRLGGTRMTRAKGHGNSENNHSNERQNMSQGDKSKTDKSDGYESGDAGKNWVGRLRSLAAILLCDLIQVCFYIVLAPSPLKSQPVQSCNFNYEPYGGLEDDDEDDLEGENQGEDPVNVNKPQVMSYDPDAADTFTSPFCIRQVGQNMLPPHEDNDGNNHKDGESTRDVEQDNGHDTYNHDVNSTKSNIQDPPMHIPITTRSHLKATGFKIANGGVPKSTFSPQSSHRFVC